MWIIRNLLFKLILLIVIISLCFAGKTEEKKDSKTAKDKRDVFGLGDGYFYGRPFNKPTLSYDLPKFSYPEFARGYNNLPLNTYGYAGGYESWNNGGSSFGGRPGYVFKGYHGPINYQETFAPGNLNGYNTFGNNAYNVEGFKASFLAGTVAPIHASPAPILASPAPFLASPAPIYGPPVAPTPLPAFDLPVGTPTPHTFIGGNSFGSFESHDSFQSGPHSLGGGSADLSSDYDRVPEYAAGIKSLRHYSSIPLTRLHTSVVSGNLPIRLYASNVLGNAQFQPAQHFRGHSHNSFVSSTIAPPINSYLPPFNSGYKRK